MELKKYSLNWSIIQKSTELELDIGIMSTVELFSSYETPFYSGFLEGSPETKRLVHDLKTRNLQLIYISNPLHSTETGTLDPTKFNTDK